MINERRLLIILAAINFTHIVDFMIIMPLGSYLMPQFRISTQEFGFIVSAYTFSAGVSTFIGAFMADRFDRKKALLVGFAGFLLGTLACALSADYNALLLSRLVAGFFGGVIGSQVQAIVADVVPFKRRATAMGALTAAFSLASVAGVPLGLELAARFSWHAPFLMVCSLGTVVFAAAVFLVPSLTGHKQADGAGRPSPLQAIRSIAGSGNSVRALLLMVVMMLGHFSIIPFVAPYLEANVGLTKHQVTYTYLTGGILTFFTSPLFGRFADRYGKLKVFIILMLISTLPMILITNLPVVPLGYALAASGLFFVFGAGRMIPAMAIASGVVRAQHRGGFMSLSASLQSLSIAAAAALAGAVVTKTPSGALTGYPLLGYIGVGLCLLCIPLARAVKPVEGQDEHAAEMLPAEPEPEGGNV